MIAEIAEWGKRAAPRLLVPAIIVLVGLSAFGLGRLSALTEGDRGLVIYPAGEPSSKTHD